MVDLRHPLLVLASRLPCDATQIGRFRGLLGETGVEELLKATIDCAVGMGLIEPQEFERVIIDATVQEKAVAHPLDSRLLEIARYQVCKAAKAAGLVLNQTHAKERKKLRRKAAGYAHAKQFKRLKRTVKCQRTILGSVMRAVQRKLDGQTNGQTDGGASADVSCELKAKKSALTQLLGHAERIRTQQRQDTILMEGVKYPAKPGENAPTAPSQSVRPKEVIVDLGFRGVDADNPEVEIVHRDKAKSLSKPQCKLLKPRQAIGPTIGHLNQDHRMDRCFLKGQIGDALNAMLAAAAYTINWLLRAILRLGLKGLWALLLALSKLRGDSERAHNAALHASKSDAQARKSLLWKYTWKQVGRVSVLFLLFAVRCLLRCRCGSQIK